MMMLMGLAPSRVARRVRLLPAGPHSDATRLQSSARHTKSSPRLSHMASDGPTQTSVPCHDIKARKASVTLKSTRLKAMQRMHKV
jgi:hypothetical protein